MAVYDWKIIWDGFVAALVAFATIGGVGGSKLAAGEMPGLASEGRPEDKGSWFVPPLPAEQDRLQSIHAVLLPNGKVLMVNGSSNRNRIERDGTIQDGVSSRDYAVVNNTALFDPSAPPIRRGSSGSNRPRRPVRTGSAATPTRASRTIRSARATSTCPTGTSCSWGARRVYMPASSSSARGWRGSSTGRPRVGSRPAE